MAPPYDVLSDADRAELAGRHPHNIVHVDVPMEADGPGRYDAAARILNDWIDRGVVRLDPNPSFTIYRMDFTDESGRKRRTVLPHERTLPKAKTDRLDLLRATRANLDPIWGLCPTAGLSATLASVTGAPPRATAVDELGVLHEAWTLTDPEGMEAVRAAVAAGPLVLADGHHRFETALAYRAERDATDPGADAILCFVVELADDQLVVHAIHRLVHGLPADVEARLAPTCELEDAGANTPDAVTALRARLRRDGGIGLVLPDRLLRLVPRADALAAARAELPTALHDVASAHFDALVRPALGAATLAYRNDASACAAMVAAGTADAAIILQPVSVPTIRDAGRAGVRMPEKTTFFWPKPRTGIVFRRLDD